MSTIVGLVLDSLQPSAAEPLFTLCSRRRCVWSLWHLIEYASGDHTGLHQLEHGHRRVDSPEQACTSGTSFCQPTWSLARRSSSALKRGDTLALGLLDIRGSGGNRRLHMKATRADAPWPGTPFVLVRIGLPHGA